MYDKRCQKCNTKLTKSDVESVPSGKYCAYCGCKVYRYVLRSIGDERDRYKQKYEQIMKLLENVQ